MTTEPFDLDEPALRDKAVRAARGAEPFDILISGATLADVATNELRMADIGLVGPLIASVHEHGARADAATKLDLPGRVLAPGLIDTHVHIESSMVTPRSYAEVVVPQGTTTICWDPHEIGNVSGIEGLRWAIAASRDLPLRVLVLAPSCVPSAPGLEMAGAEFNRAEMREMLSWPEIIGVAEVMDMRGVIQRSPKMRDIVGEGLASGKLVCGHARGLEGPELQAFAAAGITSDHEITSGEDLLAKLRAGLTIELRGSHDYVLPDAVALLRRLPHLPQTLSLCTDDIFPDDLISAGGVIDLVRRLARYGLKPIDAIRAATLNAAMRLGRRDLGLIAPGRRADIIALGDLGDFEVEQVFASGRHVAANGELITPPRADPGGAPTSTMRLDPLCPDDFLLPTGGARDGRVDMRSIVTPRFSKWGHASVIVHDGRAMVPKGASLMAVIHRHGRASPTPRLAIIEDWDEFAGAIATTVSHDSHNLTVFGRDPVDVAAAANALIKAGGGMVVVKHGQVLALLPLPVCGLLSEAEPEAVAGEFAALKMATNEVAEWKPPLRTFKAIVGATLACNPGPHLTDLGLTDGTTGEVFATALSPTR
jgi:adenine deaminase